MTGEKSPPKGLWYARSVIEGTLSIETLARYVTNHNTPYSAEVIEGALADTISCIKEFILDGKNVKLDDLAIFFIGIVNKEGTTSTVEFSLVGNVRGSKLRARVTGELSSAQINLEGQLKEIS